MTIETTPSSATQENQPKKERFDYGTDKGNIESLPRLKSLLTLYENLFGDKSPTTAHAQLSQEFSPLPSHLQKALFDLDETVITEVITTSAKLQDTKNLDKLQLLMRLKADLHTKKAGELGKSSGVLGTMKAVMNTTLLQRDRRQEDMSMRAARAAAYVENVLNERQEKLDQKYAITA